MLYQTVGSERGVGLLTVFFSLLTISMGFLVSRRRGEPNVRRDVLLTSACVTAAACLLLIDIRTWSVTAYMIVFSFFNPLTVNTLTSHYYRLMDFLPLRGQFRIESVVIRELFLNAGRVLSIFALIWFADDPAASALPIVLVCASLLQFVMAALVRPASKNSNKPA
ncbi:hypothetical protein [Cohnella thermotolerans]|uniref:hypothetical protein n=1 Tax=Cohnella thermotolerans TaxID=329858 RepID=UPI0004280284|nr:hypothetical protein [Cohnella thermotolerans]